MTVPEHNPASHADMPDDGLPVLAPAEAATPKAFPQEFLAAGITPEMAESIGHLNPNDLQQMKFLAMFLGNLRQTSYDSGHREGFREAHNSALNMAASIVTRSAASMAPAAEEGPGDSIASVFDAEPQPTAPEVDNRTELEKAKAALFTHPFILTVRRQGERPIVAGNSDGVAVFKRLDVLAHDANVELLRSLGKGKHETVAFSFIPHVSGGGATMTDILSTDPSLAPGQDPQSTKRLAVILHYGAYTRESSYIQFRSLIPHEVAKVISDAMGTEGTPKQDRRPEVIREALIDRIDGRLAEAEIGSDAYKQLVEVRDALTWHWNKCFFGRTLIKVSNHLDMAGPEGEKLYSRNLPEVNFSEKIPGRQK